MVDKRNAQVTNSAPVRGANYQDRIRAALARRGVSNEAEVVDFLCRVANSAESTVRRWFADDVKQRPSEEQFESIAAALDMTTDFLRNGRQVQKHIGAGSDNAAVASRIKYLIDRHPLYSFPKGSRADLARHLDISKQSVQRWIEGTAQPRGKNLLELARALGTTPEFLQHGVEKGSSGAHRNNPVCAVMAVPTAEDGKFIVQIEGMHFADNRVVIVAIPTETSEIHLVVVPPALIEELSKRHKNFAVMITKNDDDYAIDQYEHTRLRHAAIGSGISLK